MSDLNPHSIDYFQSENGVRLSRVQPGAAKLPFGCYYDSGERIKHVLQRLREDVCPLLFFLDKCIKDEFDLDDTQVSYKSSVTGIDEEASDLKMNYDLCNSYIVKHGADDLNCFLNIHIHQGDEEWGTQVNFFIDKVIWQDVEARQDFPVWLLAMSGVKVTIDTLLSTEKMQVIVNNVLEELRDSKINMDRHG